MMTEAEVGVAWGHTPLFPVIHRQPRTGVPGTPIFHWLFPIPGPFTMILFLLFFLVQACLNLLVVLMSSGLHWFRIKVVTPQGFQPISHHPGDLELGP